MTRHRSSKGILVDTWEWRTPAVDTDLSAHIRGEDEEPFGPDGEMRRSEDHRKKLVKDKVLKIEVRLLKQHFNTGDAEGQLRSVEFSVACDEIDLKLVGSDIEALRTAAWAKLEAQFHITWEKFFLVQIASAQSYKGDPRLRRVS